MAHPLELMAAAAKTFAEREKVYGQGYLKHGKVLQALFPNGMTLLDTEDYTRFALFNMVLVKVCRYAENFDSGGHQDSMHDLGVYSFILESFDKNQERDI